MTIASSRPPLTPAVFHILLALSSSERHGYGIMKQVEVDSQGKVTMGPGTLYGSLNTIFNFERDCWKKNRAFFFTHQTRSPYRSF